MEFQTRLYSTTADVLDACVEAWLNADGLNDEASIRQSLAGNDDGALAAEMISDWDLDGDFVGVNGRVDESLHDEPTRYATTLDMWEAEVPDVEAAFGRYRARFMADAA